MTEQKRRTATIRVSFDVGPDPKGPGVYTVSVLYRRNCLRNYIAQSRDGIAGCLETATAWVLTNGFSSYRVVNPYGGGN